MSSFVAPPPNPNDAPPISLLVSALRFLHAAAPAIHPSAFTSMDLIEKLIQWVKDESNTTSNNNNNNSTTANSTTNATTNVASAATSNVNNSNNNSQNSSSQQPIDTEDEDMMDNDNTTSTANTTTTNNSQQQQQQQQLYALAKRSLSTSLLALTMTEPDVANEVVESPLATILLQRLKIYMQQKLQRPTYPRVPKGGDPRDLTLEELQYVEMRAIIQCLANMGDYQEVLVSVLQEGGIEITNNLLQQRDKFILVGMLCVLKKK